MAKFKATAQRKLMRKHYSHIGQVVYHFSLLDWQMVEMLGLIMGLNSKQRRIAYCKSDIKGKLSILKMVCSKWVLDKELANEIRTFTNNVFDLESMRNTYAHSVFAADADAPGTIYVMNTGSPEQRQLPEGRPIDLHLLDAELIPLFAANDKGAAIISTLVAVRDDPKILKISLRSPDLHPADKRRSTS